MPAGVSAGGRAGARLDGRRALVTGADRGVGRAVALALADAGATVMAAYRAEGAGVDDLRVRLKERGGTHHLVRADVTDPDEVTQLLNLCRRQLSGLDVLVNADTASGSARLAALTVAEWRRVLDGTLTGMFLVTREALPLLGAGASVVNLTSAAALRGRPARAHDLAAKAGVLGLTRALARELGPDGIRVNAVATGRIALDPADAPATAAPGGPSAGRESATGPAPAGTPAPQVQVTAPQGHWLGSATQGHWVGTAMQGFGPAVAPPSPATAAPGGGSTPGRAPAADTHPPVALGRPGTAEDVAAAVLFLAGDLARCVTGETVTVDGGM
ncbi:NAD(P)-dependent dehydrogenase (short-subunit alcohol dehydrogenase family) [Micromonospora kangleipakensis]|uniref:NAD(P)-dependent dehydrogenase (Short-subunit alcohol dehydrogenase family) n=1 Tax=Micromonospora kangleipakensis TaxID=1077942 RepID=A0A4Q8BAN3_9ACTN|nr:SDR family oxidoreductase [Micromonospora kangleipakensis]RZU74255.1 NAD(P)-dependent dehydrogenase (short-subunit alcohol dehydrogenase family) [Micromonospora kangleipakensis]